MQSKLLCFLLNVIYEFVFVVLSFFSVLKDESQKHKTESAHNKGALLNTASGTTLYSTTVTAKALSPHC